MTKTVNSWDVSNASGFKNSDFLHAIISAYSKETGTQFTRVIRDRKVTYDLTQEDLAELRECGSLIADCEEQFGLAQQQPTQYLNDVVEAIALRKEFIPDRQNYPISLFYVYEIIGLTTSFNVWAKATMQRYNIKDSLEGDTILYRAHKTTKNIRGVFITESKALEILSDYEDKIKVNDATFSTKVSDGTRAILKELNK
jgi:hypothetical protein